MNKNHLIDEFSDNPTQRLPICLCLDVGESMKGEPIKELNRGLQVFFDTLRQDETALYAADVCVVTYGNQGEGVQCISDFSSIENKPTIPQLTVHNHIPMGEAVNTALDLIEKRMGEYKAKGVDYYHPWLVLMTDGKIDEDKDTQAVSCAQQRTSQMVSNGKLVVFPVGVSDRADMNMLAKFSPENSPLKLAELNFSEFFQWLGASVSTISHSIAGDFELPTTHWSL